MRSGTFCVEGFWCAAGLYVCALALGAARPPQRAVLATTCAPMPSASSPRSTAHSEARAKARPPADLRDGRACAAYARGSRATRPGRPTRAKARSSRARAWPAVRPTPRRPTQGRRARSRQRQDLEAWSLFSLGKSETVSSICRQECRKRRAPETGSRTRTTRTTCGCRRAGIDGMHPSLIA